jgi:hypothetical protein
MKTLTGVGTLHLFSDPSFRRNVLGTTPPIPTVLEQGDRGWVWTIAKHVRNPARV